MSTTIPITPTTVGPARRAAATPPSGPSIQPDDFVFAVFRHKWKILFFSVLGIAVGAVLWVKAPKDFTSKAQVMVRYVVESRAPGSIDAEDRVVTADSRSASMISSELALFQSGDLVAEVVAAVGASNILGSVSGSDAAAAGMVKAGLSASVLPRTTIIDIRFTHPSPGVARDVVRAVVDRYQRLHARVHGAMEQLEDLSRQNERKRSVVQSLESELQTLKAEVDLTLPVGEAQGMLASQHAALTTSILNTEAELAEVLASLPPGFVVPKPMPAQGTTNITDATGIVAEAVAASNATPSVVAVPIDAEVVRKYDTVDSQLATLRSKEQAALSQFLPTSQFVRRLAEQIEEATKERQLLVDAHPALTNRVVASASAPADPAAQARGVARAKVIALQARLMTLHKQRDEIHQRARLLAEKEAAIRQNQRRLDEATKQYEYFSTALEKARADEMVSSSRLANISVVEAASPAYPAAAKIQKVAMGCAGGGPAAGILLAFFLELFADTSLRRRKQIVDRLRIPHFLTIPRLGKGSSPSMTGPGPDGESPLASSPWGTYAEALRDRLIMYFQAREVHHKPKLIGVTSCSPHSGVTTVATALAASLSETGEGKVLYVDVSNTNGSTVHPFQQGRAVARIQDALGDGQRAAAQVNDQLYAVALAGSSTGRVGVIPRTLSDLVPRIRASDYDYIIFDLPPVSQTSITARVAGLLDTNVLVLESEKTLQGRADQAVRLLGESRAEMVAVLNKHRRYLPQRLDTDL